MSSIRLPPRLSHGPHNPSARRIRDLRPGCISVNGVAALSLTTDLPIHKNVGFLLMVGLPPSGVVL